MLPKSSTKTQSLNLLGNPSLILSHILGPVSHSTLNALETVGFYSITQRFFNKTNSGQYEINFFRN